MPRGEINQLISSAIATRSVLSFDYDGSIRFVEPHCLGIGSKGALLRGFQTGGESDSINFGWKLFTVEKMDNVRLAPPRKDFNPEDRAMSGGIIAALQVDELVG